MRSKYEIAFKADYMYVVQCYPVCADHIWQHWFIF